MSVAGTTKIVNNGADLDHFVLVVAGDGFTAADQATFEATTNSFVTTLQATPPFDDAAVWERINVYRLDVCARGWRAACVDSSSARSRRGCGEIDVRRTAGRSTFPPWPSTS